MDVYKAKYGCVAKGPSPWPEHKCPVQKMLEVDRGTSEENRSKPLKFKISIPSGIYQSVGHNTSLIFNHRSSVPTYFPFPPATELEQDYILYPLSTWRPRGFEKSHLDPDEVVRGVMVWRQLPFPAASYLSRLTPPLQLSGRLPSVLKPSDNESLPSKTPQALQAPLKQDLTAQMGEEERLQSMYPLLPNHITDCLRGIESSPETRRTSARSKSNHPSITKPSIAL